MELRLARNPGAATRPGAGHAGALVGSLVLMVVIGLGINMDVESLRFAVLGHDQTSIVQLCAKPVRLALLHRTGTAGQLRRTRPADAQRRAVAGAGNSPGFGRTVLAGQPAAIGAWFDGAMPQRGETVSGYVQGIPQHWLAEQGAGALRPEAGQQRGGGDALSLQPGREKPARHGPGGHAHAAAHAARHAHRPGRGAHRRSWAPSSTSTPPR